MAADVALDAAVLGTPAGDVVLEAAVDAVEPLAAEVATTAVSAASLEHATSRVAASTAAPNEVFFTCSYLRELGDARTGDAPRTAHRLGDGERRGSVRILRSQARRFVRAHSELP